MSVDIYSALPVVPANYSPVLISFGLISNTLRPLGISWGIIKGRKPNQYQNAIMSPKNERALTVYTVYWEIFAEF